MKFSLTVFFFIFTTTLSFSQWDLVATQATAPDQLAIDSCGNAFARVANRIYRSDALGQTWESVLDIPTMLSPSIVMDGSGGTVNITAYSTQSGLLEDFRFSCDGTIVQSSLPRDEYCDSYGLQILNRAKERLFYYSRTERLIGIHSIPLGYDSDTGSGLEATSANLDSAFLFSIQNIQINGGYTELTRLPRFSAGILNTQTIPQIVDLRLPQGWENIVSEREEDLTFSTSSIIIAKRSNSQFDSISVASYSVSTQDWTEQFIEAEYLVKVDLFNNHQFLFIYDDRIELREATASSSLIRTVQLPMNFQLKNYSSDLEFLVGTINGRVVIIHDNTTSEADFLAGGSFSWTPTLSGSVLIESASGFEEYTTDSSIPSPIDLDVEERFLLSESFGGYTYSIRQLNDRKQFLATSPSGTTSVLEDDLDQSLTILGGGDFERVVRIGSDNFKLQAETLTAITGRFANLEILVRGVDTLYAENRSAYVKRGDQIIELEIGINTLPIISIVISDDVFLVQRKYDSHGPRVTGYIVDVFEIETLERVARINPKGQLIQIGQSAYVEQTEGLITGADGPRTAIAEISWDGNQVVFDTLDIPTFKQRDAGDLCFNDFWQSFTHTVSGFTNLQHLNGNTFISGLHGVFKSGDCIIPEVQREDACLELGETIMWNGQAIDTPGFYADTVSGTTTCDQIAYLQVGQPTSTRTNECFLEGTSFPLQDTSYSQPGTYSFTGVDAAGCALQQDLVISHPDTSFIDTMVVLGTILFGEEVVSNGQQIITSRTVANCTGIFIYTVDLVSSTAQAGSLEGLKVYPTLLGADRTFQIESAGHEVKAVEVFTLSGKQVEVRPINAAWQLSGTPAGLYIVRIQTNQGSSNTQIIIN